MVNGHSPPTRCSLSLILVLSACNIPTKQPPTRHSLYSTRKLLETLIQREVPACKGGGIYNTIRRIVKCGEQDAKAGEYGARRT